MRIDSTTPSAYVNRPHGNDLKVGDGRQGVRNAEVPPPLDLPQVPTGSKLQLASPSASLQSGDYSNAISNLSKDDGGSEFSIMAYYSLMLEFAKNEKTAAREDREALRLESESLLQKAADKMRLAAGLALAGGVIGGAAQIAGGAVETVGSVKGLKTMAKEGGPEGAAPKESVTSRVTKKLQNLKGRAAQKLKTPKTWQEKGEKYIEMKELGPKKAGVAEETGDTSTEARIRNEEVETTKQEEANKADSAEESKASETKAQADKAAETSEESKSEAAKDGEETTQAATDKERFEKLLTMMEKQQGMSKPDMYMRKYSGIGSILQGSGSMARSGFDSADRFTQADEKDIETQSQKVRDYSENEGEFRSDFASLEKDVIEKASQFLQSRESTTRTIVNA